MIILNKIKNLIMAKKNKDNSENPGTIESEDGLTIPCEKGYSEPVKDPDQIKEPEKNKETE
jgi:hypothetical protein